MNAIKITSKKNHDSLWAKVKDGGSELKFFIGRTGIRITRTNDGNKIIDKADAMANECFQDYINRKITTHGQLLDSVVTKWEDNLK